MSDAGISSWGKWTGASNEAGWTVTDAWLRRVESWILISFVACHVLYIVTSNERVARAPRRRFGSDSKIESRTPDLLCAACNELVHMVLAWHLNIYRCKIWTFDSTFESWSLILCKLRVNNKTTSTWLSLQIWGQIEPHYLYMKFTKFQSLLEPGAHQVRHKEAKFLLKFENTKTSIADLSLHYLLASTAYNYGFALMLLTMRSWKAHNVSKYSKITLTYIKYLVSLYISLEFLNRAFAANPELERIVMNWWVIYVKLESLPGWQLWW